MTAWGASPFTIPSASPASTSEATTGPASASPASASAASPREATAAATRFTFFFLNDRTDMDMEVAANAAELNRLGAFILAAGSKTPFASVRLSSSASPAGGIQHNMELCYNRAQALQQFLYAAFPDCFNDSTRWSIYFKGENWEGFDEATAQSDIRDRDEVLGIIRNAPSLLDANGIESRTATLRQLHGGTTWQEVVSKVFPLLRYAEVEIGNPGQEEAAQPYAGRLADMRPATTADTTIVVPYAGDGSVSFVPVPGYPGMYYPVRADSTATAMTLLPAGFRPEDVAAALLQQAQLTDKKARKEKKPRHPIFALKTNLLFDLAMAPNVELEFPIKNRCSILLEHTFPWWLPSVAGDDYALEVLRSGVEFRYWFGNRTKRPLLTGFFLGAYANADYFDVEWQNRGWQGETFMDFGLTCGWSKKISTNWRLELSLGAGYFQSDVTEYDHRKDLKLLMFVKEDSFSWIGPTKLKCSLSWLLPNYSRKKGGGK